MAIKQSALMAALVAVNAGKQNSVASTIRKTSLESGISQTTIRSVINGNNVSKRTQAKMLAYLASAKAPVKTAVSGAYSLLEKQGKQERKRSLKQSVKEPLKFHRRIIKKIEKFQSKIKKLQDNESVLLRLGFVYENDEAILPEIEVSD